MTSYLQDEGLITAEQAREAVAHADRTGLTVRDAIVQLKIIDQETAARAFASELGRSYVDLSDLVPENDALDMVPKNVVRRHNCLPLFIDDNAIVVACADEPDAELEDEIRLRFGKPIRPVIASGKAINQAIASNYAEGMRKEVAEPVKGSGKAKGSKSTSTVATVKAAKPKKEVHELSEDEKAQRKQLGLIMMCWALVTPALLDTFLLWDKFWKFIAPKSLDWVPFSMLLVGAPVSALIYFTHVHKK